MIKILIVDDEPRICSYLADFFNQRGHVTYCLSQPAEVMALIKKHEPNIVLLDVIMPGVSGLDVLEDIKAAYKNKVKVIMVTVADDEQTFKEAKALGADDFIVKPFDTTYLESVVIKKISELLEDSQ